ncbi:decarboxylase, pyridoxal-dependent [Candidatus Vecturithrix granuli]|uniref:Decarboxylase, pyridoxal-dependent n=1 Tax=Vecturithrix granuli TaxID=1499967 RepID=A0A081BX28_VECG1|nr:decarboxylase, pyridoxal-dependent [Candidatus Vecturithrix granuli]
MTRSIERSSRLNLDYALWGLQVNERGHLVIGGCDCVELAEEYGTPVHIVDSDLLQRNYHAFRESFTSHDIQVEIYYSYKTNPIPGILRILHEYGAGAEVISPYELWLALKSGISPDLIIYNGPNKSEAGLHSAIENRIKLININSCHEIEMITHLAEQLGTRVRVGVRLCTSVGWAEQFGFSIETGAAFEAFDRLSSLKRIDIEGIHTHLGTNIRNASSYEWAINDICQFMYTLKEKKGIGIKYLDLGGGFGVPTVRPFHKVEYNFHHIFDVPYIAPRSNNASLIETFAEKVVAAVQKGCEKYKLPVPILLFEPGRAMTSNTQILLATVGDLKTHQRGKIAMIDAGMNIALPTSWEYHEIFVANKMASAYQEFYSIVGPICTPQDVVSKRKKLPELEIGDLVSIMDAGAYFTSFSNDFSFPRPAVVMVSGGRHRVLRERERYDDMTQLDRVSWSGS